MLAKYHLIFTFDIMQDYLARGLIHVLCTNISLDGTLNGPDYDLYETLIAEISITKITGIR